MAKRGIPPGVQTDKFCPLTTVGIRRSKTIPYGFDADGTATATYNSAGVWYGYLGVNTGMSVRVVRMQATNTGATDKSASASTNPVFCVYKGTIGSAQGLTLAISSTCLVANVFEGVEDIDGPVFGPTDRLIVALLTAGVAADAAAIAGTFTITIEYIEGDDSNE